MTSRSARRPLLAALLVACASASWPASAQTVAVGAAAKPFFTTLSDAEVATRVQTVIDRFKDQPEMVGLSIAVGRADKLLVDRAAGMANLEWNQPATVDSLFRIGSITKQFTAAGIMKLVERGQIGLDDPLSKHVPNFDTGGRIVTIRQLLNHSSGIVNYTALPGFVGKDDRLDRSTADLLALASGKPFTFEPGTGWSYSNTDYVLLTSILEKVSGKSYAALLQTEFFTPLGLSRTRTDSEADIIPQRAGGYGVRFDTGARRNAPFMSTANAGGAGMLLSTAGDLVRWQMALINGRAVTPPSFQQMIGSPADTTMPGISYGFGLMVDTLNGQRRISHSGGINGFNSTLTWLPESGLITAVISNSGPMPSGIVEDQIIAALTSDEAPPPPRTTAQPGGEAALRKLIADASAGTPDYATMSPQMQEASRAQLSRIQEMLKALGAVRAVTFERVTIEGLDIYRVDLEKGALLYTMALLPDGKIATVFFRAAPTAP
jgi:D-alanyl-D-alanine carboxypeptidase